MKGRANPFQVALDGLKEQLAGIGAKTQDAVHLAVQCYLVRDIRLCSELLSVESELSQCQRNVDEIAIGLHCHHRPDARDLRVLAACMKINTTLKCIGDIALLIADQCLSENQPRIWFPENIRPMGIAVSEMVHRALCALNAEDADIADTVCDMDDIVRRIGNETWMRLVAEIRESPKELESAISALFVIRNLERASGFVVNMARDVLSWICGAEPPPRARSIRAAERQSWPT